MTGKPLSPEIKARVLQLRAGGRDYQTIAAELGISYISVSRICRRGGQAMIRQTIPPEVLAEIPELRAQGLLYKEIARKLHIGITTVADHCQRNKIAMPKRVRERERDEATGKLIASTEEHFCKICPSGMVKFVEYDDYRWSLGTCDKCGQTFGHSAYVNPIPSTMKPTVGHKMSALQDRETHHG